MQYHAQRLNAEMASLMSAAARRWLAEIEAAEPGAGMATVYQRLMARANNELVSWIVSSPGEEREATEWRLAQQPSFCRVRSDLHEKEWALLAERLLLLQPLQGSERAAAIAAERRRFERWLAGDLPAQSTPTPPPQLQAFQAAERQRAGEPVAPNPMSPWLSRQVMGESPPKPYADTLQSCALVQWWLANEVQQRSLAPAAAMRLFRFGTLPASERLLLMRSSTRDRAFNAPIDDYPPIAQAFELTGVTRVALTRDASGRVRDVQIMQRRLQMPGLAPGQVPLAFEQTLDRAAFARVRAMTMDKPDPNTLRNGVARAELELVWKLD